MSLEGNVNTTENQLKGKVLILPTIDKTLTKEGCAGDAKAVGDALETRVKVADIVNNLTTNATDKPLSASQGVELQKQIKDIALSEAGSTSYDNTNSGLSASNMQSAIDEVAGIAKGAVSKNGTDVIEGPLKVRNADNGYGAVSKNNSVSADYGTQLLDVRSDGKSSKITVSASTGLVTYTDVDNNIRDIFHEGNKPFGSYTGNGSTEERTIEINAISRLLLVYNPNTFSFVTPEGALVIDLATGTFKWIDGGKVFFVNDLKLYTNNVALNAENVEYIYQAI